MKCANAQCGIELPAIAKFCVECGTPVAPNMQIPSDFQYFIYLLEDEQLRRAEAQSIQPPYGSIGITLADGVVNKIHYPQSSRAGQGNAFGDFLRAAMEFSSGLIGQKKQHVRTYVMMDLRHLPIVTHSHSLSLPGVLNASLRFKFWIDGSAEATNQNLTMLGLFFQRFVRNRNAITLDEFRQFAIAQVEQLLQTRNLTDLTASSPELRSISEELSSATGISVDCDFVQGVTVERRQFEIAQDDSPIVCAKCGTSCAQLSKFCEHCGAGLDASDFANAKRYLKSADGQRLRARVSLLVSSSIGNSKPTPDDGQLRSVLLDQLAVVMAKHPLDDLRHAHILEEISAQLTKAAGDMWHGLVSEVAIIDIRSATEDWFFKVDALLEEELKKIDANKQFLALDERNLDLNEAAFAIALRRTRQDDTAQLALRQAQLEAKKSVVEFDIDEHKLDTQTSLRKESVDDEASKARLELEKDRVAREESFQREIIARARAQEKDQIGHEISLEKTALAHDLELGEIAADSQSRTRRRVIGDVSFEKEEELRLQAASKEKLGHLDEDIQDRQHRRQVDKMQAMVAMEMEMAKQDHSLELSKRELMKGLDPAQMIAIQAAELTKLAGGGRESADVVKALAESQAAIAGVGIKDVMYQQLLEAQRTSTEQLNQTHREAAQAAAAANERMMDSMMQVSKTVTSQSSEGYKEAAKISQSVSEKSMESMSKVATAAAGKKNVDEKSSTNDDDKGIQCDNEGCNYVFKGKVGRFCPKCGQKQGD